MNTSVFRKVSVWALAALILTSQLVAQAPATVSGKRAKRVVVRNAMVVDGSGKPASGPYDIVVENDIITQIVGLDPVAVAEGTARRVPKGDLDIDATGKYVLPG